MGVIEQLNFAEVVRVAINMEVAGYKFYTELAKKTKNSELQRTVSQLALDEKEHIDTFRLLSESLGEAENQLWADDELVVQYLRALVHPGVFEGKDVLKVAGKLKSEADALLLAMQAEKDAILFYLEACKLAVSEEQKKIFLRLAEEEKKHLVILKQRLDEFSKTLS